MRAEGAEGGVRARSNRLWAGLVTLVWYNIPKDKLKKRAGGGAQYSVVILGRGLELPD